MMPKSSIQMKTRKKFLKNVTRPNTPYNRVGGR